MPNKKNRWTRRDFFKTAAVTGAGALLAPVTQMAEAAQTKSQVPQRPFGKSGINVSIPSLADIFSSKII
jgi:hypothetical protein